MIGWRKRAWSRFAIILHTAIAGACAVPDVEETREVAKPAERAVVGSALRSGEVFTIMGDPDRRACLQETLTSNNGKFRFIAENKVRDALYPWFETESPTPEFLSKILDNNLVRRRLEEMNIRYIVTVSGSLTGSLLGPEKRQDVEGGILCGYAGCLGFEVWDRTSRISASVFDVKHRTDVGSFGTKASGKSSMPVFVIPIPMISPTETTACVSLAKRLARYFAGQGETSLPTNNSTGSTDSRDK